MTLLDLENSLRAAAGLCVVTGPETAAAVLALQQQQHCNSNSNCISRGWHKKHGQ